MSPADSYRILELPISASQPEVKASYHNLVRRWHPDRFFSDPDNRRIAEQKIREINGAYEVLSKLDLTQKAASELPGDSADTDRSWKASFQSRAQDVFYTNVEEAMRSATFESQPQDIVGDTTSDSRQAATESHVENCAACAYVGGDPRLKHLAPGFLGCAAVVALSPWGLTLCAPGVASVAYPAKSIRSVLLSRRSSLAFLSESTVRIRIVDLRYGGFLIKLRFPDRNAVELFAGQIEKAFGVKPRVKSGWFHPVLLLIVLLAVLTGLVIIIGLNAKRTEIAIESSKTHDLPVAALNEDRGKDQNEASIPAVTQQPLTQRPPAQQPLTQQPVAQSDASAQTVAVAAIKRIGGTVIETQGKVVRVKLAGARVHGELLEQISSFRDLEELSLIGTTMKGEEFRYFSELSRLRVLDLAGTHNASAGVKHLIGLTGLQVLRLSNTNVGDPELKLLEQLPELVEIELFNTKVTKVGIEQFKASLPICTVEN